MIVFEHDTDLIANPYLSPCGRYPAHPTFEYGFRGDVDRHGRSAWLVSLGDGSTLAITSMDGMSIPASEQSAWLEQRDLTGRVMERHPVPRTGSVGLEATALTHIQAASIPAWAVPLPVASVAGQAVLGCLGKANKYRADDRTDDTGSDSEIKTALELIRRSFAIPVTPMEWPLSDGSNERFIN